MQEFALADDLKKDFLVGDSSVRCFITCCTSHRYKEKEINFFLSSPNGCPDKRFQNLKRHLSQDECSKCWSISRICLFLSSKKYLSSFPFCVLINPLLGFGFHEMSKNGEITVFKLYLP